MKPAFSCHNVAHVASADFHVLPNVTEADAVFRHFPNRMNLIFGEFAYWAVFATIVGAVFKLVLEVTRSRVIAKIFKSVIEWVAVIVATIHAIRSWANKCKQNKIMDIKTFALAPNVEINVLAINSINCGAKYLARLFFVWRTIFSHDYAIKATNSAKIGNFVNAFIAGHGFPNFFHVVAPSNAPKIKIHGGQWSNWFSGANLSVSHHCKAKAW